ncbi:MAG TPA: hypothetical protein VFC38_05680 [Stellaceae bacterium]|nr:hypothetical protein [Stellaceae bacterium]
MSKKRRNPSDTVSLKVRIKERLRAKLEAEARDLDITLNAVMGLHLEQPFQSERELAAATDLAYGRQLTAILIVLGRVMRSVATTNERLSREENSTGDWISDPYAFDQTLQAAITVLKSLRPPGDPNVTGTGKAVQDGEKHNGPGFAEVVLDGIAGTKIFSQLPQSDDEKSICERLGPKAVAHLKSSLKPLNVRISTAKRKLIAEHKS